jgi:hypothetical protein
MRLPHQWLLVCVSFLTIHLTAAEPRAPEITSPAQHQAAEVRTWTFSKDGVLARDEGGFSFKQGGRVEGLFVRLDGTNDVVIKRHDASDFKIAKTSLSKNDLDFLNTVASETEASSSNRMDELKEFDEQVRKHKQEYAERAKERAASEAKALEEQQRISALGEVGQLQAQIEAAQSKLDYENLSPAQFEILQARNRLEKMTSELKRKYPDQP